MIEIEINNRLSFFKKYFFLCKNFIFWYLRSFFLINKYFRNKNYVSAFYDHSRRNINVEDLNFDQFVFGKKSLTSKRNILFHNNIYYDYFYKPTLYRYSLINKIIKYKVGPGKTVCDLGCGWGSATLYLAKKNPEINFIGIDLSKESIRVAQEGKKKFGLNNVDFYNHDITNESFVKNKINFLFTINVLEQLDNHLEITLKNIIEMKPKNILFYEPDVFFMQNNLIGKISKKRSYCLNKLQALYPLILKILKEQNKYDIISAKNLGVSVNPFNSSSEIILEKKN